MCFHYVLLRAGRLMSTYTTKFPGLSRAGVMKSLSTHSQITVLVFVLIFSGAAEGSVWNTGTKAPSPLTVTGQTGLPGPLVPGPAEEGCRTGTDSAQTPGERSELPPPQRAISLWQTSQRVCGRKLSENNSVLLVLLQKNCKAESHFTQAFIV